MRTRELIPVAAFGAAAFLSATACSSPTAEAPEVVYEQPGQANNPQSEESDVHSPIQTLDTTVTVQYFSDGTREINLDKTKPNTEDDRSRYYAGRILQFCVDGSFYSQTEGLTGVRSIGSPTTEIVDAPWANKACADNQLTPNDFK